MHAGSLYDDSYIETFTAWTLCCVFLFGFSSYNLTTLRLVSKMGTRYWDEIDWYIKEGADKLFEILALENQGDKSKDKLECAAAWSTASNDDVKPSDEEEREKTVEAVEVNQASVEDDHDHCDDKNTVTFDEDSSVRSTPTEVSTKDEMHPTSSVDQLVKWCQVHDMLLPVYTYCNPEQDKDIFLSTVLLSCGLRFDSTPQHSREEAMEAAAYTAITSLMEQQLDSRHYPFSKSQLYNILPEGCLTPMYGVVPNPSHLVEDTSSQQKDPNKPDANNFLPCSVKLIPSSPPCPTAPVPNLLDHPAQASSPSCADYIYSSLPQHPATNNQAIVYCSIPLNGEERRIWPDCSRSYSPLIAYYPHASYPLLPMVHPPPVFHQPPPPYEDVKGEHYPGSSPSTGSSGGSENTPRKFANYHVPTKQTTGHFENPITITAGRDVYILSDHPPIDFKKKAIKLKR